jgi:hypothetical protein
MLTSYSYAILPYMLNDILSMESCFKSLVAATFAWIRDIVLASHCDTKLNVNRSYIILAYDLKDSDDGT